MPSGSSTDLSQQTLLAGPLPSSEQPEPNLPPEQKVVLENEFIRAEFSTHGGAIRRVSLLKHTTTEEQPVVINLGGPAPILNLKGWGGVYGIHGYQILSQSADSVTLGRELGSGLQLQRTYTLKGDYTIGLEQTVTNTGGGLQVLGPYLLDLGSQIPTYQHGAERALVGFSWQDSQGGYHTHKIHEFDPAMIPLIGIQLWSGKDVIRSKPEHTLNWVAMKNQFFVLIVDPLDQPAVQMQGTRRLFPELREKNQAIPDGVVTQLTVPGLQVDPGASVTQRFEVYAGPRENSRLIAMGEDKAAVMEFGMFSWVSRFLLWSMNLIHDVVQSYGWAIVILTIFLKAILWTPQGMANRSMKRMAAVAPLIKEIQEKYKDKPEKLNEEMIKVYKDYGVNPVGGCFPLLLQFPIFLGFYSMLQTAIELRHQSFLWITDLSQPDTIFHIPFFGYDFPVNPMPLIMAATMYWSMSVTPQPAGVDNPMIKIMKFMPILFLLFCYNFSSALSLYWTVQNLLSIVQLYVNLRLKEITLDDMKAEVAAKRLKAKALKKKKP
ncbi:MAG: membrane protein insertase YidC [Blastochloris sp.]|nr:membrane protein insertase YidC [Blastochloris sp.]